MRRKIGRDYLRDLLLLAADSGDGGNGGTGAGGSGSEGAPEGNPDAGKGKGSPDAGKAKDGDGDEGKDPADILDSWKGQIKAKYISQLPKEFQKDDFTGIEDIGSLYRSYKEKDAELKELREHGSNGYVKIPSAESTPDERKEFWEKIGVPKEGPDGYQTMKYDGMADVSYEYMAPLFREAAYRCGLSKKQAEGMWLNLASTVQGYVIVAQKEAEAYRDSFDTRYSELLKEEIPDETRRKDRIEQEKSAVRDFGEATGTFDMLEKTGLTLTPSFMHSLASWYSKVKPLSIFGGGTKDGKVDRGLVGIYKH